MEMEFEWDDDKAQSNLQKHSVSFEDAARVFLDSRRIEAFDKRNIMKFKLDAKNPPAITAAQMKRLEAVAAKSDKDIDYSDDPRQSTTTKWTRPGALVPAENKQQVTLRLDKDILSFFKRTGERYQSRINAVLREYVKAHS